jgi:hypothetical protein
MSVPYCPECASFHELETGGCRARRLLVTLREIAYSYEAKQADAPPASAPETSERCTTCGHKQHPATTFNGGMMRWGCPVEDCVCHLGSLPPHATAGELTRELHIVFDGPPGPESGRFVEVEDETGHGVNAGEWRKRTDGLWELVIKRGER